jgi:AcrR family transcriptional regulator
MPAAVEAFSVLGYDGVSLRTVNEQLGVSRNLLYQRFGSKANLWRAVVDWAFVPLQAHLEAADDESADPMERLRTLVRQFIEYSATRPYLARLATLEGAASTDRLDYIYDNYIGPLRSRFLSVFEQLRQAGRIKPIPSEVLFFLVTSGGTAAFGQAGVAARMKIELDPGNPAQVRAYADHIAEVLLHGIATSPLSRHTARPQLPGRREFACRARTVAQQVLIELSAVDVPEFGLLRLVHRQRGARARRAGVKEPGEERFHVRGAGPVRLVGDLTATVNDPGHVRHRTIPAVHCAGQVIHQDRAADTGLVAQQPGIAELAGEGVVVPDVLTRMCLASVDEYPFSFGVPGSRGVEQRTLCGAVRSSERAEFHHQRSGPPQFREPDRRAIIQPQQREIGGPLPGAERGPERILVREVSAVSDILVEMRVVVRR